MFRWVIALFAIAIVAGFLECSGIGSEATNIAKLSIMAGGMGLIAYISGRQQRH